MSDDTSAPPTPRDPPEIERARQLFLFLKAYAERNVPHARRLNEQLWILRLRELPQHPAVTIGEVQLESSANQAAADEDLDAVPLLRVKRPKLTPAPRPPAILADFLEQGWERCDGEIKVRSTRNVRRDGQTVTERFDDDPARPAALEEWRTKWLAWAEAERPAMQAMRVFERLYDLRGRIERESEQVELMLGDGQLRWERAEGTVDHPVLLQRVELEFDPSVPEFRVLDADRGPELYSALIAGEDTISPAQLNQLRLELEQGGYHPLARDGTSGYLRRLVQLLGPRGTFHDTLVSAPARPDPVIMRDPVLFLRQRTAGYAAAFDRVLQDLESRAELPVALTRLVGVEPPPPPDPVESVTSPWGEPPDVLLSKPANAEQVQIARALERHRAVLVQGPPGTGKTHTIANLIGHLVAQGKRVLVTSHTTKALRVLRDEVAEPLQPLCVAVLENDLEGRKQMEHAVRGILTRLTDSSDETLTREAEQFANRREALNAEIDRITADLRAAREAEYLPIVVAGESIDPAEAARWVRDNADGNDWIPGTVQPGAPLPLSEAELRELYSTNAQLTAAEDKEITGGLPAHEAIPDPETFAGLVADLQARESEELAPFWERKATEDEIAALDHLAELVRGMAAELKRLEPWQRAIVAAGHAGGTEHDLWVELARQVAVAAEAWEKSRLLLLDHEVEVPAGLHNEETRRVANEIGAHVASGGKLGGLGLLFKGSWKAVLRGCRVNGTAPAAAAHFRAIATHLALEDGRTRLATRWARQAVPAGLPAFSAMGSPPEPALRDYAAQVEGLLDWWRVRWGKVESAMAAAGFRWPAFRQREVARSAPATPFERDAAIMSGPLQEAVTARAAVARVVRADRRLRELDQLLARHTGDVCAAVRTTVRRRDPHGYGAGWNALQQLIGKERVWQRRRELLERLSTPAAGWARAICERTGVHGAAALPGDPSAAWRWRQLHQEIDRRAALDEVALARRLEERRVALREVTAQLIDRRAWLAQRRRTGLEAQLALQGWANIQRRIGKGTGKRVPALRAEARRLLDTARVAVPVWIMPLSRVADSFDATSTRFDVVIVDEASQSDVTGLLAWYLGDRIAVVGDNEQVSPLAVGQRLDAIQALIDQYLDGIPNNVLYAGTTSVYDFAGTCFGGTIRLREHFRCVPDIIEFSNELCYDLEIRPLRDPGSARRPHVVEYVVQPELGAERSGKVNLAEARAAVALLEAMIEMDEYAGKTLGAITLLGDEQADCIQDLALRAIGAVELDARRFVAGNSAQFQGDQRHVIVLSMVDTPTGGVLRMQQRPEIKQRYNVAASRAKDQLWLVHSLDPDRDLQAGDLRRRLIEHVRDPGARRREMERAQRRAESPFERAVIERLVTAGYRVEPQVWVGRYRIDMVISDGVNQVAVECDGDRYHGFEQIPEDMARQAVLERAGWRFVRIRGTRFYRNPQATMAWVFEELTRLGVKPTAGMPEGVVVDAQGAGLRDRVIRRAWEIMYEEGWVRTPAPEDASRKADDPSLTTKP